MKSLFEQMGGTYRQKGDYLILNLALPDGEDKPIGIWGQRHLRFISQSKRIFYIYAFGNGAKKNCLFVFCGNA